MDQCDRPMVGKLFLCSLMLRPNAAGDELRTLQYTVLHELLHVLGYSYSAFAYFRDENGMPRTTRDEYGFAPTGVDGAAEPGAATIQNGTQRGHRVQWLITPSVKALVRLHTGCNSLPGLELEDGGRTLLLIHLFIHCNTVAPGGPGTSQSHPEKRVFNTDVMVIKADFTCG